jgi:endonuclease IV
MQKTKRTKQEQFIVDVSHAYAKYGIVNQDQDYEKFGSLHIKLMGAIKDNFEEISKMLYQLESWYTNDDESVGSSDRVDE